MPSVAGNSGTGSGETANPLCFNVPDDLLSDYLPETWRRQSAGAKESASYLRSRATRNPFA
jgi:hypothetical protein